jgi:hypothetical protein
MKVSHPVKETKLKNTLREFYTEAPVALQFTSFSFSILLFATFLMMF